MRIEFHRTGAERKALVTAIGEILEVRPKYKGMPSAAYEIDYFTVTKNGTLEFDERADSEEVENLLEQLADRGIGRGRDFHQVQVRFSGPFQGLAGGQDAQLLAGGGNQTDLAVPNLVVDLMTHVADTKAPPILRYIQKNGYQSGTRIQPEHARAASDAHGKPD